MSNFTARVEDTYRVSITADGLITVVSATIVLADGEPVGAPLLHAETLEPGADLGGKPPSVVAIAAAVWTEAVVSAYQAAKAAKIADLLAGAPDV